MLPELSHFRTQLLHTDVTLHRAILVMAGDKAWSTPQILELLYGLDAHALWIGDDANTQIEQVSVKKARHWLGREKKAVVFDVCESFDADAFAAISGVVVGGGVFIVLIPPEKEWSIYFHSRFSRRFISSIKNNPRIVIVHQHKTASCQPALIPQNVQHNEVQSPYKTVEQQQAVEHILKMLAEPSKNAFVLVSDRGRGKSAALGIAAAHLLQHSDLNIVVTAPRYNACDVVFKHASELTADIVVKHKGLIQRSNSTCRFIAPDELIQQHQPADLLLVDEAAAIPVPMLSALLEKYKHSVFATTVHGYEGTGRGFSLRFISVLDQVVPGWEKLDLKYPIRWPENDPLERWVFELLCLDAEIADVPTSLLKTQDVNFKTVDREELVHDQAFLSEIFGLLVLAHYRTRPSDLIRMIDDEAVNVHVGLINHHVVAVALTIDEGGFDEALSAAVYQGKRRIDGHLLAQTLAYHCGNEHAAVSKYRRIMRIVVHPVAQRRGIGGQLLIYTANDARYSGCDAIGASFGMTKALLNFWWQSGFEMVRVGFTREQSSGEHSVVVLKSLSSRGEQVLAVARQKLRRHLPYLMNDVLHDLPDDFKNQFNIIQQAVDDDLSIDDIKEVQGFIEFSRNFEISIAGVNRLIKRYEMLWENSGFPESYRSIIKLKTRRYKTWSDIAAELGLNGKIQARKQFKLAVKQLFYSLHL